MKNLPEKTPPSTGLPADSNGASVSSTFHGAASASAPSSSPGGSPLSLSDLPCTPRAQFEGLAGKRPDLCLCDPLHSPKANHVSLKIGTLDHGPFTFQVTVWSAFGADAIVILAGGLN